MGWIIFAILFVLAIIYFISEPSDTAKEKTTATSLETAEIKKAKSQPIFHKREYFFRSAPERIFYEKLKTALADTPYTIFAQVRLADLVKTPFQGDFYKKMYLKTLPYHVDFVICHGTEYIICLAIEFDGPHHFTGKQAERDSFKSRVLQDAQIPLIRFRAEEDLTPMKIKSKLEPYF